MSVFPEDTAVTTPVALTVATDGLLDDHTPFNKIELKVAVLPTHNGLTPVMILLAHGVDDLSLTVISTVLVVLHAPVKL